MTTILLIMPTDRLKYLLQAQGLFPEGHTALLEVTAIDKEGNETMRAFVKMVASRAGAASLGGHCDGSLEDER